MTPEGKVMVTRNLKQESALKSGGYSFLMSGMAPSCHRCITGDHCEYYDEDVKKCLAVKHFQEGMEQDIMSLPHIQESDRFLVKRLAKYSAFLFITDEWLENTSAFVIEGNTLDFQPIINNRIKQEVLVIRLCSQLGLTPDARARIGLNVAQTYSLAQAFNDVNNCYEN